MPEVRWRGGVRDSAGDSGAACEEVECCHGGLALWGLCGGATSVELDKRAAKKVEIQQLTDLTQSIWPSVWVSTSAECVAKGRGLSLAVCGRGPTQRAAHKALGLCD